MQIPALRKNGPSLGLGTHFFQHLATSVLQLLPNSSWAGSLHIAHPADETFSVSWISQSREGSHLEAHPLEGMYEENMTLLQWKTDQRKVAKVTSRSWTGWMEDNHANTKQPSERK